MGNLINHQIALSHATIQPAWVRITHWIDVKLGCKNLKRIVTISVTNEYPSGYWEKQGYNWFGFPMCMSPLSAQQPFTEHPCLSA